MASLGGLSALKKLRNKRDAASEDEDKDSEAEPSSPPARRPERGRRGAAEDSENETGDSAREETEGSDGRAPKPRRGRGGGRPARQEEDSEGSASPSRRGKSLRGRLGRFGRRGRGGDTTTGDEGSESGGATTGDDGEGRRGRGRGRGRRSRRRRAGSASDEEEEEEEEEEEGSEDEEGGRRADDNDEDDGAIGFTRRVPTQRTKHVSLAAAEGHPEVYIVGEIEGGAGFPGSVSCRWFIDCGQAWSHLEGAELGQTHVDVPGEDGFAVWAHPIDVHYATSSIQGWPRLGFSIYHLDSYGRSELISNGFVHVPAGAGSYELKCPTWRPSGTPQEEATAFFLGGVPQLKSDETLFNDAWGERSKLYTIGSGTVHVRVDVILKNFTEQGVEWFTA